VSLSDEFRIGPFSIGDLIALGGVVFMSGALFWRVAALEREDTRQQADSERVVLRLQSLEQVIPSNYIRREDYREDMREIKTLLQRVEAKIDGKADRP
jgi:hypothetical protein